MKLETFEAIATAIFIVMGFAVGLRMLLLARRTRELPELTLGGGLFLIVGLGYPLFLSAALAPNVSLTTGRLLAGSAAVLMNFGWWLICLFTWRVFRPDAAWARVVGAVCGLSLAALTVARFVDVAQVSERVQFIWSSPSMTATRVFALAIYVWTGVEALLCHARLKRQLALGLIEAVVVNRVLLWAWVAACCFTSVFVGFFAALIGVGIQHMALVRLLTSIAGLGCGLALYLAFFPPRFYLRRVAGATA